MKSFLAVIGLALVVALSFAIGSGNNGAALLATWVFFPAAIALYFCPTIVAVSRNHPNKTPIIVINVLLGWTGLGWIGSLAWAFSATAMTVVQQVPFRDVPAVAVEPVFRPVDAMKKCPYCAESIRAEAVKCRYCASDLTAVAS